MKNEDKDTQSIVDKTSSSRRKLLKSVVAGGGAVTVAKMLPDQWARPVVDSVMLPSHAQTSFSAFGPFVSFGPFVMNQPSVQLAEQGFSEELLEFFTPAAQAAVPEPTSVTLSSNASGNSYLCAIANVTTEMISIQIQNTTPPSFTSNACLFGTEVQSGRFVEDTGWLVTVLPLGENVTTKITLVEGGSGCTTGDPGSCRGG